MKKDQNLVDDLKIILLKHRQLNIQTDLFVPSRSSKSFSFKINYINELYKTGLVFLWREIERMHYPFSKRAVYIDKAVVN